MTTGVIDPAARSMDQPVPRGRRLLGQQGVRVGLGILLVVAVGLGAFLLSSSLASSSSPIGVAQRRPAGAGGLAPGRFGPPGSGAVGSRPIAVGSVASIASNTFSLTTRAGTTITVGVSSSTTYTGATGLSDLKVGERVVVVGTSVNSKEIDASRVLVGVGGRGFGGNGRFGGNSNVGPSGGGPSSSNAL